MFVSKFIGFLDSMDVIQTIYKMSNLSSRCPNYSGDQRVGALEKITVALVKLAMHGKASVH